MFTNMFTANLNDWFDISDLAVSPETNLFINLYIGCPEGIDYWRDRINPGYTCPICKSVATALTGQLCDQCSELMENYAYSSQFCTAEFIEDAMCEARISR